MTDNEKAFKSFEYIWIEKDKNMSKKEKYIRALEDKLGCLNMNKSSAIISYSFCSTQCILYKTKVDLFSFLQK